MKGPLVTLSPLFLTVMIAQAKSMSRSISTVLPSLANEAAFLNRLPTDLGLWIRANKPQVKVLLTSGFAPELLDTAREQEFQLLRKPFNRAELARALSDALYGLEEG
jgi:hypothetical protein